LTRNTVPVQTFNFTITQVEYYESSSVMAPDPILLCAKW